MTTNSDQSHCITLLIPGLLLDESNDPDNQDCKSLRRLLSNARDQPVPTASLELAVLNWFQGGGELSHNFAAQLGYRFEYHKSIAARACLFANPVFQQIDINQAVLADSSVLDLTRCDAESIIVDLNKHFSNDGVIFELSAAHRWYCHFDSGLDISTNSQSAATGKDVSLMMPTGSQAGRWRSWLAEIEMLLHSHPVNAKRAAEGKAVINSLWLWGEGELDDLPVGTRAQSTVFSNNFYTQCVANHYDFPLLSIEAFSDAAPGKEVLVVDDRLASARARGDQIAYGEIMQALEKDIFEPLDRNIHGWQQLRIWTGTDRWLHVQAGGAAGLWKTLLRRFGI